MAPPGAEASKSIMKAIAETQKSVEDSRFKVDALERKLRLRKDLDDKERERLEKELSDIKRVLAENESVLNSLYGENRRTASLAAIVFVVCFFLYCLYSVFFNPY